MRLRLFTVGASETVQHIFGPEGGIFGRSLKCDWVLPDPERILSAVHGRIRFENNRFMLVDESTNGIFIADRTEQLGRGNTVVLTPGMTFRAGRLVIQAEALAPEMKPANAYPASLPVAALTSSPQGAEQALREREVWGDLWGKTSQDPLSYLDAAGSPPSPRPGVVPAGMIPAAAPPPLPLPSSPEPVLELHDLLPGPGDQAFPGSPPPAMPAPAMAVMPIPAAPAAQLPPGFPPSAAAPAVPAPAATAAPVAASPATKLIPDDFDPLSMIVGSPASRTLAPPAVSPVTTIPQPVHAPPPSAMPAVAPTARPPLAAELMADLARLDDHRVAAPEARGGTADPLDAMEAMKARSDERKARLLEKAGAAALPPLPGLSPAPATRAAPAAQAMPATGVAPAALAISMPVAAPAAGAALPNEAAKALFRGMGFPDPAIPAGGEAALLYEVGEMMRALSEGLVSLLAARKLLKSEFRMDETQVQPEENNPFKHFKMAELALDELFITRSGGFQAPAEAAASALDDIKGHVMLTTAAMQRAIRLLVERLDPKVIAREPEEASARIRGLGARKGKWELYSELHQRLSGNLDGITRQIIGEAFAQVQEEQARRSASQFRESKK